MASSTPRIAACMGSHSGIVEPDGGVTAPEFVAVVADGESDVVDEDAPTTVAPDTLASDAADSVGSACGYTEAVLAKRGFGLTIVRTVSYCTPRKWND